MNKEVIEFWFYMAENYFRTPLHRNLMTVEERKLASTLHKNGLLQKGKSDPEGLVIYYVDMTQKELEETKNLLNEKI